MSENHRIKIPESKLVKALAELEGMAKGDPLEDQDPEGGLSAEGKPLSDQAPSGRGETKKSRRTDDSSSIDKASDCSSDDSSDDDDGGDDDSSSPLMPPKKKGKVSKSSKSSKSSKPGKSNRESTRKSSGDDDSAGDDESSSAEKSFREMAEGDETMRKAIVVNDFLEAMTDQLSLALHRVQKSIAKSFRLLEERITDHIDDRVAKGFAGQSEFNSRLAKAVSAIGNIVQDDLLGMADMMKSLVDQPVSQPRGKAVLTKGEVNQPPWSGAQGVGADQRMANGSEGDYIAELRELPPKAIGDWLFKKSANSQIDPNVLIAWEADRYDVGTLPMQVRKALADELIK